MGALSIKKNNKKSHHNRHQHHHHNATTTKTNNKNNRTTITSSSSSFTFILFITITVILVCCTPTILAGGRSGSSSSTATRIGTNPDVLEFRETNYSIWQNGNETYASSTYYHAQGMGPLYKIANQIIRLFVGDVVVPEGYLVVTTNSITLGQKVQDNEWGDLLKHYWAILLVMAVCALIIVLMPIIGLCFCCCRCAGACGGRSQPFDKKHDTCRRVFLGLLLILAGTGMIFGVVVAFVTNSYLQRGIENATYSGRSGVNDSQKFLRSTSSEAHHLLNENFDELNDHLTNMLKETANFVIDKLETESKAISLTQLTSFIAALPIMEQDLSHMRDITNGLRVNASQLSDGLRGVKRELLISLTKCDAPECRTVLTEYKIGKLDMSGIDYNQMLDRYFPRLPDVSATINNVNELIMDNWTQSIKDGQNILNNMRENLDTTINENIPKVTDAIAEAGSEIKKISRDMTGAFEAMSSTLGNNTYRYFDLADEYIAQYSKFNYYGGLAISSTLLLVLLCVVLGLLCGICGKRPDGYGDDCCNKGAGSRFLMIGVAVIFLTISILTACAFIYFFVGILLRRGACIPLNDPSNDQVFALINQYVDLNVILYPEERRRRTKVGAVSGRSKMITRARPPLYISDMIESCHRNESIYNVIGLENYFDINEIVAYPKQYGIELQLNELIRSIDVKLEGDILSKNAELGIDKLKESQFQNFDADKFFDNLNEVIVEHDLNAIADRLRELAVSTKLSSPAMSDVRTSLKNQALHLRSYQENLVQPMTEQTTEMRFLTTKLNDALKFNRSSFSVAIEEIRQEILDANKFITINGTSFIREVAEDLVKSVITEIDQYLNHVINKTQNELGRCGPLSNVYKSLVVAGCNRVVDPLNGFWAGVAWCVLIFLPTIIISVKLSSLYQKSDPYPGPLVESEYLYDAYSERDCIPLSNGPKNKRRNKKNERRRSSRDRRGDYYEDSGSPHGPSSGGGGSGGGGGGSRDARYNDMAPKHWNGGPPRYQNPPMAPPASEYERPPPYYFPGAPSEAE